MKEYATYYYTHLTWVGLDSRFIDYLEQDTAILWEAKVYFNCTTKSKKQIQANNTLDITSVEQKHQSLLLSRSVTPFSILIIESHLCAGYEVEAENRFLVLCAVGHCEQRM